MVNNRSSILRLLPACECLLTQRAGRDIITNGPVYCLKTAQENLTTETIFVLNDNANIAMVKEFSPELQDEELVPFIKALTPEDRKSSERCRTSINRVIDCDGYAMRWNRYSQKRWNDAPLIYVKFGFAENNPKLLVISIHPSR